MKKIYILFPNTGLFTFWSINHAQTNKIHQRYLENLETLENIYNFQRWQNRNRTLLVVKGFHRTWPWFIQFIHVSQLQSRGVLTLGSGADQQCDIGVLDSIRLAASLVKDQSHWLDHPLQLQRPILFTNPFLLSGTTPQAPSFVLSFPVNVVSLYIFLKSITLQHYG